MIFQMQRKANTWSHMLSKILATEVSIGTNLSRIFTLYTVIAVESFPWLVPLACEPRGHFWFSYENFFTVN